MKKVFEIIFGLILILAGAAMVVVGVVVLLQGFLKLNVTLQTGIATAVSVIIVAIIGYFTNKSRDMRKSVEQAMRPKKLELYEEFITFFLLIMGKEGVVKRPSQKEIMDFFVKSNPLIVTYGSNEVIEKWGKLRVTLADGEPEKNLFLIEDLMQAIRKDLGHSKKGSARGDILRLFVNDIDNYIKKK